jgi:hypothetical protein
MYSKLKAACFPAAGATPKQFRISGAIFLVAALVIGSTAFAAVMQSGNTSLGPVVLLIPIIVWLMGVHRILWGGAAAKNSLWSAARVVVTIVLGYGGLIVVSGLLGGLVGLIVKSA